jgi:cytochrome b6-f complex iron-sulfur subunit
MAKRLSVKEILEAARRGGPAQPAESEASAAPAEEPETPVEETTAPAAAAPPQPTPAANVPPPASPGRPLTLKEKLAAARAGGTPPAAAAPAPAAAAAEEEAATAGAVNGPPAAPAAPAPAAPLGRPMTLQEKLAAARGGAATPAAATAKPAGGKPAAATAAAKAAAPRTLPPLEKITDPKDLAEALRQSGAKKAKESAAAAAAKAAETAGATPAKAATAAKAAGREKETKPQTVLPKPSKGATTATAAGATRRGFMLGPVSVFAWVVMGWAAFTAGLSLFTAMLGRFMFPNVLAEPPSTVKVGLPSNFEPEEVNERFKAEWGFWIVRSTRYNGEDIVYALQSVCTHLGCPPNWLGGEQKFKCPCHGSGFYVSGVNFEGPAPRPLERFKVTLADDGQMIVDKSQKFQQELGQWSEPESYITA